MAYAALAAFLFRLPGLTRPIRADEAGFVLVARAWDPSAHSVYGPYWVDRPPQLIAVVRAADALGGPQVLRVVGALGCAVLVLLAAQLARMVGSEPAARWTAVATAAFTTTTLIDAVAVKGEVLALPFLMGSFVLVLLAVRRRSAWPSFAAGLVGALAVGFKQNLVGGLVFGGMLLVGSLLTGALGRGRFALLAAAFTAGVAVPVAATVAWASYVGLDLSTLWYVVYGFRSDAGHVVAAGSQTAPLRRAGLLLLAAVLSGLALVVGGFLVHLRDEWRVDRALTAATLAVVVTDLVGLVLGGSFWRDYLLPLVPGAALCVALLVPHAGRRGRRMRLSVGLAALSWVVCFVGWSGWNVLGLQSFSERDTGDAIAAAAGPDDTLVVYGGRSDVQLAAGLPSPYRFLWSLPMRTLDPDRAELRTLLAGPDAPTWLVEWVPFRTWDPAPGALLEHDVLARYERHGTGCDDHPVYLLRGLDRPALAPDCG